MSLPKSAKMVFKGPIFEVYQRQQKMFDWTFEIFEKIKRADTVIVLAAYKGKMVICKQMQPDRKSPSLSLPGWRIDPGEKPLHAAKRELLEETWMKAKKMKLRKIYVPFHKIIWTTYVYIAQWCQIVSSQNLDHGEQIDVSLISFEKFLKCLENGKFYFSLMETDVLKMEKYGKLDTFKKLLFA